MKRIQGIYNVEPKQFNSQTSSHQLTETARGKCYLNVWMFEVNLMLLCCAWEWIQCRRILSLRVIHLIHWICCVRYYIIVAWILHHPLDWILTPLYSPPPHPTWTPNQQPRNNPSSPTLRHLLLFSSTFIFIAHLHKIQRKKQRPNTTILSILPSFLTQQIFINCA